MTLTAITRRIGSDIVDCALTFMDRRPIDIDAADRQHEAYEDTLRRLGVDVISLPALPGAPDATFVEDTAIVLDELAVLTVPALQSRRLEVESIACALTPYRRVLRLVGDARLEGGDVMRVEQTLYVGLSRRTNSTGIDQLRTLLERHGYRVEPVPVDRALHLKTACTYVGDGMVLANPDWVDVSRIENVRIVPVDRAEPFGANAVLVGNTVVAAASAPRTAERLRAAGRSVVQVDMSETEKAEGGLTCCSLLFET